MKISKDLRNRLKKKIIEAIKNPESREVVVRTPYKMSSEELDEMKSILPSLKQAILKNEVDASLIGGLVIVDGSMILDYSVKGKINNVIDKILD